MNVPRWILATYNSSKDSKQGEPAGSVGGAGAMVLGLIHIPKSCFFSCQIEKNKIIYSVKEQRIFCKSKKHSKITGLRPKETLFYAT